jgi:hypothetical protein
MDMKRGDLQRDKIPFFGLNKHKDSLRNLNLTSQLQHKTHGS